MTVTELLRQALVGRRVEIVLHDPAEWGNPARTGIVTAIDGDNPDLYIEMEDGTRIDPRASDLDHLTVTP